MKRRVFLGGFACLALPALAQPRTYRLAWFTLGDARSAEGFKDALLQGLRDLGYHEGRNFSIEVRSAPFTPEMWDAAAAEVIALKPDLIVAQGPATRVMSRQRTTVPVVFGFSGDPVDAGAAVSMARPGRNMTGMSFLSLDLVGKRIEILKEALPQLRRIGVIANPEHPGEQRELAVSKAAASKVGLDVSYHQALDAAGLHAALDAALAARAEALVVFPDYLTNARRGEIAAFTLKNGIPAISGWSTFPDSGLLLSYGPNLRDSWYRIAYFVDRVLKGADPATIPVELPRNVELVINATTARTLAIRIPQSVLARADRVIE